MKKMNTLNHLTVDIPGSPSQHYPIIIDVDLLSRPETWLPQNAYSPQIVIITDDNLKDRFGLRLVRTLQKNGLEPLLLSFPAGEQSKQQAVKQQLEEQMLLHHCDRKTLVLALGGGVVGDMAGFVAATFMRGISYIQIPTTLLAMVDSSIGGKTGINTEQGKNLIGAFWHPQTVVADLDSLKSLPRQHLTNGLIEAVKMFLTNDKTSFFHADENLEALFNLKPQALVRLIIQAINIKKDIVHHDEKENRQRMALNFGHTIGHALELLSQYSMLHGYAVGLGILVEAKISELEGLLSSTEYAVLQGFFSRLDITGKELRQFTPDAIIQATQADKKALSGQRRYVLLDNIGKAHENADGFAHPVANTVIIKAIKAVSEDKR